MNLWKPLCLSGDKKHYQRTTCNPRKEIMPISPGLDNPSVLMFQSSIFRKCRILFEIHHWFWSKTEHRCLICDWYLPLLKKFLEELRMHHIKAMNFLVKVGYCSLEVSWGFQFLLHIEPSVNGSKIIHISSYQNNLTLQTEKVKNGVGKK